MIKYESGCSYILAKAFQCRGSVFPTSFAIALPCGILTAILRMCLDFGYLLPMTEVDGRNIIKDNSCWSGFTFLVGFLVVFRTSQAYSRFWDGCTSTHQMRAEWYDACSALCAFCKYSTASTEAIAKFQHLMIRLFSMLHAVALADIEDSNKAAVEDVAAFRYELVDVGGIDVESLRAVKHSDAKVELVFQWIQQVIVENISTGVLCIPAPILSRSFQEIANGMVAFHEAIKISTIPFPFPYAQVCDCLLIFHWLVTPVVVAQFVETPWWAALFSFLQVFVYWSLNAIAVEIENPFGMDANDIDAVAMQTDLNRHLLLLLEESTRRTPHLARHLTNKIPVLEELENVTHSCRASLLDVWEDIDQGTEAEHDPPTRSARRRAHHSGGSAGSLPLELLPSRTSTRSPRRSGVGHAVSGGALQMISETSEDEQGCGGGAASGIASEAMADIVLQRVDLPAEILPQLAAEPQLAPARPGQRGPAALNGGHRHSQGIDAHEQGRPTNGEGWPPRVVPAGARIPRRRSGYAANGVEEPENVRIDVRMDDEDDDPTVTEI